MFYRRDKREIKKSKQYLNINFLLVFISRIGMNLGRLALYGVARSVEQTPLKCFYLLDLRGRQQRDTSPSART